MWSKCSQISVHLAKAVSAIAEDVRLIPVKAAKTAPVTEIDRLSVCMLAEIPSSSPQLPNNLRYEVEYTGPYPR